MDPADFMVVPGDENTVPAQVFEEDRNNSRNSQRVFLIVLEHFGCSGFSFRSAFRRERSLPV